jgi:hypothetical protein
MKSRLSKSLGKEVFDEYKHFLSKNHKYLPKLVAQAMHAVDCIGDVNSFKKIEREQLLGKGTMNKVRGN